MKKTTEPKEKSNSKKGSVTEEYEAEHYRKMNCVVQKVYLRATYISPGKVAARPGDFFAVPVEGNDGRIEQDSRGKPKKRGSVDIIAICPDAVHVCTVTSIKDDKQSLGPLYKRERALDRGIPAAYPVKADSALYIGKGKMNVRRRHRDKMGEWQDEVPPLKTFQEK